jgi:hypothetical protein
MYGWIDITHGVTIQEGSLQMMTRKTEIIDQN